ncbi:MAG: dipeptidase PepE [Gemmatimonadales bacterium]
MARRLLLFSNSSTAGMSYLEHAEEAMREFLGAPSKTVLFVPYAAVSFGYHEYTAKVRAVLEGIGHRLDSVDDAPDVIEAVQEAEAIAVGGGNTFHLVRELQERGMLAPIRDRVLEGMPFIGWSAGSNIACPTLRTTNDMPIVEPRSFRCLDLIPFQINPHYLDVHPDGHMGETREQRIQEFLAVEPNAYVVGLREGSALRVEGDGLELIGEKPMRIFKHGEEPLEVMPGQALDFLLE